MSESFVPYELTQKFAQGGMAEVFLATRKGDIGGFSKQLAIKRIFPHLAEDPELITMFFDEARIAARLGHPNIVQIFDLGEIGGFYYIAMEFIHGRDLRSLCERGIQVNNFVSRPMAARIISEAAAGLHYAHTRLDEHGRRMNIVHRDVSPQNVLISMNGNVKVCDFGIAKAEARMSTTRMGQFKGKFAYKSPEQVVGDEGVRALDARSDIFSLGIVLYEITVCTRLFRGKNDYETIRLVAETQVPPPSQVRPGFPPELERIILKSLARDPADRYQTAEEMQMALEDWLIEQRVATSPVHIARYMRHLFPELLENPEGISEDHTVERQVSDLVRSIHQANNVPAVKREELEGDAKKTFGDIPSVQHDGADATRDIVISKFEDKLKEDQELQRQGSYPQVMSTPLPQPMQASAANNASALLSQDPSSGPFPQPNGPRTDSGLEPSIPEDYDATRVDMDPRTFQNPPQPVVSQPASQPVPQVELAAPPNHVGQQAQQQAYQPTPQPYAPQPQAYAPQPQAYAPQPEAYAPQQAPMQQAPAQQAPMQQAPVQQNPQQYAPQPQAAPYTRAPQPSGPWRPPANNAAPQASSIPMQGPSLEPSPAATFDIPDSLDSGPSESLEFEMASLRKQSSRQRLVYVALVLVVAAGVFGALYLGGTTETPDLEKGMEKTSIDPKELVVEPPKPLDRTDVSIITEPEGASVIVNGLLASETTPSKFSVVAGRTNEIMVFREGFLPAIVTFKPNDAPETITLEPVPKKKPKKLSSLLVTSNPEGGTVYHNGVQIGLAPVTIPDLLPTHTHHISVQRKGSYPFEGIIDLVPGTENRVDAALDALELDSRRFEVNLDLRAIPRGTIVTTSDKEAVGSTPTERHRPRHALLELNFEARDKRPLKRLVETREVGTYLLRPYLPTIQREKGTITLNITLGEGDELYLGPSSYTRKPLKKIELREGKYPLVLQTAAGKRYETRVKVAPNTLTTYRVDVLNGALQATPVEK